MKNLPIIVWVLRVLVALMFAVPAVFKLIGDSLWAAEFTQLPTGVPGMYVVGLIELIGVMLVLRPKSTIYGSMILLIVTIGAVIAQVLYFHNYIHLIFWLAAPALLLYLARTLIRKQSETTDSI